MDFDSADLSVEADCRDSSLKVYNKFEKMGRLPAYLNMFL